jgi:hypothetical protein
VDPCWSEARERAQREVVAAVLGLEGYLKDLRATLDRCIAKYKRCAPPNHSARNSARLSSACIGGTVLCSTEGYWQTSTSHLSAIRPWQVPVALRAADGA